MLASLARLSRRHLGFAAGLYLVEIACTLCTPVAINYLLKWVAAPGDSPRDGVLAVAALFSASLLSFFAAWARERASRAAGAETRVRCIDKIYASLLASPAVDKAGSGELLNLLGSDADALADLWHGLIGLLLQPIEIVGCIGLLFVYVRGGAAAGGLAVLACSVTICHVCAQAVTRLDAARNAHAELRLRDIFEMLLGVRVVKYVAWETLFSAAILKRRGAESALARRAGRYIALINVMASNSVDLISLAVI